MKKKMDINYDRREENEVDSVEMLMCIQAWHEMINPGHHSLMIFSDGSGSVQYAVNCPEARHLPLHDRPVIRFHSLRDFVFQTRKAMQERGWEVVDTKETPVKKISLNMSSSPTRFHF